ncbi:hypothetical protein N9383_02710 [Granulosicoccus sp.]|nr:hypothetical protein [Granulosicoccus sp.]
MNELCLSCEITSGRQSVPGGVIFESEFFHAHQDVAYPVPGQIILAAKRHFRLLTEMLPEEVSEFVPLVQSLRKHQGSELGIDHVYYFYNEDTRHHFHLWMVPRYPWMSQFGRSIDAVRPALVHARDNMGSVDELTEVMNCAERLKQAMRISQ